MTVKKANYGQWRGDQLRLYRGRVDSRADGAWRVFVTGPRFWQMGRQEQVINGRIKKESSKSDQN